MRDDPRVSGAWREGDPPAGRRFADVGSVVCEFGGAIPDCYEEVRPAADTPDLLALWQKVR